MRLEGGNARAGKGCLFRSETGTGEPPAVVIRGAGLRPASHTTMLTTTFQENTDSSKRSRTHNLLDIERMKSEHLAASFRAARHNLVGKRMLSWRIRPGGRPPRNRDVSGLP